MSLFVGNVSRNATFKDLDRAFTKHGECKIELRVSEWERRRESGIAKLIETRAGFHDEGIKF